MRIQVSGGIPLRREWKWNSPCRGDSSEAVWVAVWAGTVVRLSWGAGVCAHAAGVLQWSVRVGHGGCEWAQVQGTTTSGQVGQVDASNLRFPRGAAEGGRSGACGARG